MKNRVVEQYRGFLKTFPLWEGSRPFGIEQFNLPPFSTPHPQEDEILNKMPSLFRNYVLGKRMEIFFSYLIRSSSEYDLMAENLQISRNKITIGEIDFLIEDRKAEVKLHIELVYKFYLYDPSVIGEVNKWIGPNRKDSLPQKIRKLQEKQLPLLYTGETIGVLRELNLNYREVKQQVCFKAKLFVPRKMLGRFFPLINNSCICGFWIHLNEFNSKEYSGNQFFLPKKNEWPSDPANHTEWFSFSVILDKVMELHGKNISPLLWMKTQTGKFESFFVVWW